MSLREIKKQQTKQAILDAAIELFSKYGYENTSIEQISRAAGIGKGTVYGYFQTKKDIIMGFCEYELDKIHKELTSQANPQASILDQMMTIYMTEFKHVTSNREFGRIFMRETVFPPESDINEKSEMEDRYFDLLFPIYEKAQAKGELRPEIETLHLTAHFYGIYLLVISAWYSRRIASEEVEEAMRSLFSQALDGLKPTSNKTISLKEQ